MFNSRVVPVFMLQMTNNSGPSIVWYGMISMPVRKITCSTFINKLAVKYIESAKNNITGYESNKKS